MSLQKKNVNECSVKPENHDNSVREKTEQMGIQEQKGGGATVGGMRGAVSDTVAMV